MAGLLLEARTAGKVDPKLRGGEARAASVARVIASATVSAGHQVMFADEHHLPCPMRPCRV